MPYTLYTGIKILDPLHLQLLCLAHCCSARQNCCKLPARGVSRRAATMSSSAARRLQRVLSGVSSAESSAQTRAALGGGKAVQRTQAVLERLQRPVAPRFAGRSVFVTGGGSGIGAAACVRIAAEGGSIAVVDKRLDTAQAVADEITASGGSAIALEADVAVEEDVAAAVAATVSKFGGIDAVFSNAGTSGSGWIHETSVEDFERILKINLTGCFIVARHTLPYLMESGCGSFVSTGSIASLVVGAGGSAASYAASKGGINMFTKQIAVDYSGCTTPHLAHLLST